MSQPKNLTEGNILSSLMGFALPVLAALFLLLLVRMFRVLRESKTPL